MVGTTLQTCAPHPLIQKPSPSFLLTALLWSSPPSRESPRRRGGRGKDPQKVTDLEGQACHLFPHFRNQNLARGSGVRSLFPSAALALLWRSLLGTEVLAGPHLPSLGSLIYAHLGLWHSTLFFFPWKWIGNWEPLCRNAPVPHYSSTGAVTRSCLLHTHTDIYLSIQPFSLFLLS